MAREVDFYRTPQLYEATCEDCKKVITSKYKEARHSFHKRLKGYKWRAFKKEQHTYYRSSTVVDFNLCNKCYKARKTKGDLD